MSIAKVLEVISEGKTIEEAINAAAKEVSNTLENVRQVNVDHIEAVVEKGKVAKYRVGCKVSFIYDPKLAKKK